MFLRKFATENVWNHWQLHWTVETLWRHDTQHNDTQQNDSNHKIKKCGTQHQHNIMLSVDLPGIIMLNVALKHFMLSVVMLSVVALKVVFTLVILSVVMLSFSILPAILSAVMLSVVIGSVLAPTCWLLKRGKVFVWKVCSACLVCHQILNFFNNKVLKCGHPWNYTLRLITFMFCTTWCILILVVNNKKQSYNF